ncbi:site-2 protease family protein [Bradyrhizobium retamae]|nr:site-2 protease family protein [Bradyrhizobium retamae]
MPVGYCWLGLVWTLSVGYFPQASPGLEPAFYWAMGVAGLLGLAVSIVLHELAHAVVARQYDMPIRGITLFVFGGVAEMEDEPTSAKGEFLMAIAGPIMSLGLAIVFYLLVLLIPGGVSVADGEMALSAQAVVLLYLAGIN